MSEVDIFVGNSIAVDEEVYQLWLDGYTAQEAAQYFQKRGILQKYNVSFDILLSDLQDNYRNFNMLERMLQSPVKLHEQFRFQIDAESQRMLIEKYYEFNSVVIRELLGKKLTSKQRKDLDDVSEKTRVPLRSCRRQFDNIKRVFKSVEEMKGSLVENIKNLYLLPFSIATQYAAIVFLANNRLETGKKKLYYLTFDDFVVCANNMITNWSYSSVDCQDHEDMDVDLDRDFFQDLRDLKCLLDRELIEDHKSYVCKHLKEQISEKTYQDLDSNFKNMSRVLINIATSLNHTKDSRDFFVDLVEKFIEPCRINGWTHSEVTSFFNTYTEAPEFMESFKNYRGTSHRSEPHTAGRILTHHGRLDHVTFSNVFPDHNHHSAPRTSQQIFKLWERYIQTAAACIIQMYHL